MATSSTPSRDSSYVGASGTSQTVSLNARCSASFAKSSEATMLFSRSRRSVAGSSSIGLANVSPTRTTPSSPNVGQPSSHVAGMSAGMRPRG
ncbi:Uncharacterised protein [Mycobacteroides abscessus]|nr:Uncharacterised protein [Mycobacteroides abscessus]